LAPTYSLTMASDKAITNALLETVRELFKGDLDALSVNNVRKIAEEQLHLESGFLKGDAWKAKSKEIITREVVSRDPLALCCCHTQEQKLIS
jgi:hypothetical protein